GAELEAISGPELALRDPLAVHERAVRAREVVQHEMASRADDLGVTPRGVDVGQADFALPAAPEYHLAFARERDGRLRRGEQHRGGFARHDRNVGHPVPPLYPASGAPGVSDGSRTCGPPRAALRSPRRRPRAPTAGRGARTRAAPPRRPAGLRRPPPPSRLPS